MPILGAVETWITGRDPPDVGLPAVSTTNGFELGWLNATELMEWFVASGYATTVSGTITVSSNVVSNTITSPTNPRDPGQFENWLSAPESPEQSVSGTTSTTGSFEAWLSGSLPFEWFGGSRTPFANTTSGGTITVSGLVQTGSAVVDPGDMEHWIAGEAWEWYPGVDRVPVNTTAGPYAVTISGAVVSVIVPVTNTSANGTVLVTAVTNSNVSFDSAANGTVLVSGVVTATGFLTYSTTTNGLVIVAAVVASAVAYDTSANGTVTVSGSPAAYTDAFATANGIVTVTANVVVDDVYPITADGTVLVSSAVAAHAAVDTTVSGTVTVSGDVQTSQPAPVSTTANGTIVVSGSVLAMSSVNTTANGTVTVSAVILNLPSVPGGLVHARPRRHHVMARPRR